MDTHDHPDEPAQSVLTRRRRPRSRTRLAAAVLAVAALLVPLWMGGFASATPSHSERHKPRPTIVLVHGDWADGSSWNAVTERLQHRGYTVVAPPNLLRGPSIDAPYLASYLQSIDGPIVLVAHSYGGFVATNAATGNTNIKALVYVDAFVPDTGQTLAELTAGSCIDLGTALDSVPIPAAGSTSTSATNPTRPTRATRGASPTASTASRPPCSKPPSGPPRSPSSSSRPEPRRGRTSPRSR